MADRYLLESGSPDGYLLEDGSGVLLLDDTTFEITNQANTSVTYIGSGTYRIIKAGGAAGTYDASAVSSAGVTGDFVLRINTGFNTGGNRAAGVTADPLASDSYDTIDRAWLMNIISEAVPVENGSFIGSNLATGSYIWIWRTGSTVGYGRGADLATAQASPDRTVTDSSTLYFDSSLTELGDSIEVYFAKLLAAYSMAATAGSFTLSGQAAGLKTTRVLTAAAGSFAVTGQPATLRVSMPASTGVFTLAGQTALLKAGRRLSAVAGAFTLTGNAAALKAGRILSAAVGSFILSGQAAALKAGRRLAVTAGSFALSGQAAGLLIGRRLAASAGAFTLSGNVVNLLRGARLPASSGVFVLVGQSATLSAGGNKSMSASAGSFVLSGQPAILRYTVMIAGAGAFILTGATSSFAKTYRLSANTGSFSFYGYTANLTIITVPFFPASRPPTVTAATFTPPTLAAPVMLVSPSAPAAFAESEAPPLVSF